MKELDALAGYMTATECAEAAGVKLETFTAYVSRRQAPQPVALVAGKRMYDRVAIAEWIDARTARAKTTGRVDAAIGDG